MSDTDASGAGAVATTKIDGIIVYDDYIHHLQTIPADSYPAPFLLKKYVEEQTANGARSDHFVYAQDTQFHLQLRTGPFLHTEYHVQAGEEWYYVMQGEAFVQLLDERTVKTVGLPTGTCFLLPGGTPKRLQICAGGILLVMTRQRKTNESYPHYNKRHTVAQLRHLNNNASEPLDPPDQLLWRCTSCAGIAHTVQFECENYFAQSSALIAAFDQAVSRGEITCKACKVLFTAAHTILTDLDAPLTTIAAAQTFLLSNTPSIATELPSCSAAFPMVNTATHPPPYHLFSWIDSNLDRLKPPVCNAMIHGRGCQWKVMIVGGPNQRTDYHIDDGEEWFLMIKGDMVLKVVDKCGTEFRDIAIKEGESFLLPANVPHSPQRFADTIGLVIERDRFTYELDGLRWHCSNEACRRVLRTFSFRCEDLGSQLKVLIEHWYEDSDAGRKRRTCPHCGTAETKPTTLVQAVQPYAH